MAHIASNKYNYWRQLGILTAVSGVGILLGGIVSMLPLVKALGFDQLKHGMTQDMLEKLLTPSNADMFREMQFFSTLFVFFLPPLVYAHICHKEPFAHLGFTHTVTAKQIAVVMAIMLACLPLVGALQELTEMFPWSKTMLLKFKAMEDEYNKEVAVMGRMDNVKDYIVSLVVIALLPAIFEETMFRGGLQNLFSRWFKMPVLAVVITAILFSAVHGSVLGFLSRFALGFVLGWMYYKTGNIWLNITAHFFNNALAVTSLYLATKPGEKLQPEKLDQHFPLWLGLVGIALLYFLFQYFDKVSEKDIDNPGRELLIQE